MVRVSSLLWGGLPTPEGRVAGYGRVAAPPTPSTVGKLLKIRGQEDISLAYPLLTVFNCDLGKPLCLPTCLEPHESIIMAGTGGWG